MATLRVPGAELYYEVTGNGVPVVLVHGLALDARMWDEQVPALSDIATVIRYDARGFGRSLRHDRDGAYTHADDLWLLVDHLGIETVVLVGLSMGGRIVVEAALRAPKRVRALVLLDAVLDGVPWDPESERGMQAIESGLRSGGLAAAKAAWLRHGFFAPARRAPTWRIGSRRWLPTIRACTGPRLIRTAPIPTASRCSRRWPCRPRSWSVSWMSPASRTWPRFSPARSPVRGRLWFTTPATW